MAYNCTVEYYPMVGTARILYAGSALLLIACSLLLQVIFAMVCQKMKGWKSDFAFYLLQIMTIFSILSYIGLFSSYVHGIVLIESTTVSRITGSNYQGSFLSFVITTIFLTIHRLLYTIFPFKAPNILTTNVLKAFIVLVFIFYTSYMAFTLSPLASVRSCPSYFFFYFDRSPFYPLLSTMNKVSNYLVGVVNVSAYFVMFTTLFLKGVLTFKKNNEIKMTVQAAVVSILELIFFLYWEYGPTYSLPEIWKRVCDGYSILIYFDVLILPYVILNKSVKDEIRSIFCGRPTIPVVKISADHMKAFQRRSI